MTARRPHIVVVDYGAGNLVSIEQALDRVGAAVTIGHEAGDLRTADAVVVPGVGAARPAMERLRTHHMIEPLRAWLAGDRPFLGICLGLQLLFDASDEDGALTLGAIPGRTIRLEAAPTLPHTGWNQVDRTRDHPLFDGIADGADFYFVHSYAGEPTGSGGEPASGGDPVLATTEHGTRFTSAIARDGLLGVQFHPERSGDDGLRLLANFVDLVRAA
jgi:imidazole glycerol-phosphate synthase subunit HisH